MSLPSSMVNFVPCDRLLQRAYFSRVIRTIYTYQMLKYFSAEFTSVLFPLRNFGDVTDTNSLAFSLDPGDRTKTNNGGEMQS